MTTFTNIIEMLTFILAIVPKMTIMEVSEDDVTYCLIARYNVSEETFNDKRLMITGYYETGDNAFRNINDHFRIELERKEISLFITQRNGIDWDSQAEYFTTYMKHSLLRLVNSDDYKIKELFEELVMILEDKFKIAIMDKVIL
jgi:hypothetical protein